MSEKINFEDSEESPLLLSTNRGIKLNHPGRKYLMGRAKCPTGTFASHQQAIQAVQQQHMAEQLMRSQQPQLFGSNSSSLKKVHPLQRQFLRSRSAFIRPVR